jgi:hypothetical protein
MKRARLRWVEHRLQKPVFRGDYLVRLVNGFREDMRWDGKNFRDGNRIVRNADVSHWLVELQCQEVLVCD